jgi:hypothetical protein
MSHATVIRDLLRADSGVGGVATTLTGGIWEYEADLGTLGLSADVRPEAYSVTTGRLLPACIVKARAELPTGALIDPDGQWQSTRQVIELWYYHATTFTELRTARARAYFVLQDRQVPAAGSERAIADISLIGDLDLERDPEDLSNAARLRQDWALVSTLHV